MIRIRRRKPTRPQLRARINRRILVHILRPTRPEHTPEQIASGLTDAVMHELARLTGDNEGADFAMILGYELGLEEAGRDLMAVADSLKERP